MLNKLKSLSGEQKDKNNEQSAEAKVCGYLDKCSAEGIVGWAAIEHDDTVLEVEVVVDGAPIGSAFADIYRSDLLDAGIGNGAHGFKFLAPAVMFDGDKHKVAVREKSSGKLLSGSPQIFQASRTESFHIDLDFASLVGWARLPTPQEPNLPLEVVEGNSILTTGYGQPNSQNPNLVDFSISLPTSVFDGRPHLFSVRCQQSGFLLANLTISMPTALTPDDALMRYAREGLRPQMAKLSGFRYESFVRSMEMLEKQLTQAGSAGASGEGQDFPAEMSQLIRIHQQLVRGFNESDTEFEPLFFPTLDQPLVSIVIPVHNKFAVTYHCLMSLLLASNKASFEVILVDDGSTDISQQIPALIKGVQYLRHEEAQGFVLSCNAGAELARGQYILMLNNDTEVTSSWLDELLWPFSNFEQVGMVGAKLLYPDGSLQEAGGVVWNNGDPWNYGRKENPYDTRFNYSRQVDYLSGACVVLPKELWREIGGFDEIYVPAYFEDTDLAFQVRARGFKTVYTPLSQVIHFEGQSNGVDITSGMKRFQEVNRSKFKSRWVGECRNNGKIGHELELNKDRNVDLRALVIDAETPMPDKNAGSYAAVQEIRMLQTLGFKCTFVPTNLAWMGHYTEALQRMGVETIYAPYVNSIKDVIEKRGSEFDLIYITRYYVATEFIEHIRNYAPQAKIVLNNADLHFLRELRAAIQSEDQRALEDSVVTRDDELSVMRKVDLVLSYTDVEKAVILSHNLNSCRVEKCPWVADVLADPPGFADRSDIAFLGSYSHAPNAEAVEWFAKKVLPLLAEGLPEVNLRVYGSGVPKSLIDLAEEHDNLIIEGWVPSVEEVYDHCRVFVAPLQSGAGIKGKVIGAIAHGVPSVVSPIAAEGISVSSGVDAILAEKPAEWVAAISRLYLDEAAWSAMSDSSIKFAQQQFGFEQGAQRMKDALEQAEVFTCRSNKTLALS